MKLQSKGKVIRTTGGDLFSLTRTHIVQREMSDRVDNSTRSILRKNIKQLFRSKQQSGYIATTSSSPFSRMSIVPVIGSPRGFTWDYKFDLRNNRRVSLQIGCKHFDGTNLTALRKWALR